MAHRQQMVHIRPLHSHHWHFSICPTTAERVLSQHWRNGYPASVARRSQPGSHIICCELLPYQVLLTAQRDGNHCQLDWLRCCSWEDTYSCSPNVVPCDFTLFGLLKKYLAGTWFGMDADTKQAATSWLQILDTDPFYAAL